MTELQIADCFHCNGTKTFIGWDTPSRWVQCVDCGAQGPRSKDETEAVNRWNYIASLVESANVGEKRQPKDEIEIQIGDILTEHFGDQELKPPIPVPTVRELAGWLLLQTPSIVELPIANISIDHASLDELGVEIRDGHVIIVG